jgi:molecular chaperone HtpG
VQYTFIESAKSKGYDVLLMDGQLDSHFINSIEAKFKNSRFTRVDADIIDKLIQKDEAKESKLSAEQKETLTPVFKSALPETSNFFISYEDMSETDVPAIITQNEWMRRMKDMSSLGGGMNFYGEMPDSFNLVVNSNHPLTLKILSDTESSVGKELKKFNKEIKQFEKQKSDLQENQKSKKPEEIPQAEKDILTDVEKQITELEDKRDKILLEYGKTNQLVKQLADLALLANNMLKGEALSNFVKRSVGLIKRD